MEGQVLGIGEIQSQGSGLDQEYLWKQQEGWIWKTTQITYDQIWNRKNSVWNRGEKSQIN